MDKLYHLVKLKNLKLDLLKPERRRLLVHPLIRPYVACRTDTLDQQRVGGNPNKQTGLSRPFPSDRISCVDQQFHKLLFQCRVTRQTQESEDSRIEVYLRDLAPRVDSRH